MNDIEAAGIFFLRSYEYQLLTMYCSFLFINDRVCHELYIHCIS